jgi:peptidyl-tRNA hydrolase
VNKFFNSRIRNIGAEYVNTRHNIGFKILDYFAKEQLSFQTVKLGALAEYKFKGRTFPFKAEYLHELIWESGTILDGQRKYFT